MQVLARQNLIPCNFAVLLMCLIAPAIQAQEVVAQYGQEDFEAALANGLFDEAETMAKARLDAAIRDGQGQQLSTVALINDLADVQRMSGDYDTAIQNYELSIEIVESKADMLDISCLLYTSPSPRDATLSRMPSSA